MNLPQAKWFIDGVLKVQNQAIRMILHGVMKILTKKRGGVKSISKGACSFS